MADSDVISRLRQTAQPAVDLRFAVEAAVCGHSAAGGYRLQCRSPATVRIADEHRVMWAKVCILFRLQASYEVPSDALDQTPKDVS